MRTSLALLTTLATFGCHSVEPSLNAAGIEARVPHAMRVLEDADAIQSGMDRARANMQRAGL